MRGALAAAGLMAVLAGCGEGDRSQTPTAVAPGGTPGSPAALGPSGLAFEGPYVHENLAVFIIRGPATDTRDYLTLDEGLSAGAVVVREFGSGQGQDQAAVNTLEIENKSDRWVFLQAGDVIKGGKQDRTISLSAALPPHMPAKPVGAFCVEHGRWQASGGAGYAFGANTAVVNSNALKIEVQGGKSQQKVWEEVARQEVRASFALSAADLAPAVASSSAPAPNPGGPQRQASAPNPAQAGPQGQETQTIQVAQVASAGAPAAFSSTGTYNGILENGRVKADRDAYVAALLPKLLAPPDAVGIAVAINGEVTAAEGYGSPALFRKLAKKLLESYALEALLARDPAKKAAPPGVDAVRTFLAETGKAEAKEEDAGFSMRRKTQETEKAVRFEYRSGDAAAAPAGWSQYGK